jgi:two-component system chemotaxis response regulator CheB
MTTAKLRVLVVDDSAFNRKNIADILSTNPDLEVVGRAADGEEALRLAIVTKPDVITLDLEMPRMDGFTFLRILMARQPVPVIVISSYSQKENVFKALEIGALDFIAKPDRYIDPDLKSLRDELLQKVALARNVRTAAAARKVAEPIAGQGKTEVKPSRGIVPRSIVAIASSTGGPSALVEIFGRLPTDYPHAILVAQHMPENFTRTFAERLDRRSTLSVSEGKDLDSVDAGRAFVCPGRQCMDLEHVNRTYRVRLRPPDANDRYVPSADSLLTSTAKAAGRRAIGVVLTGMGNDGAAGAKAIVDAGGVVVVESESTAVVYGMPGAVVRAKIPCRSMPLPEIADWLAAL